MPALHMLAPTQYSVLALQALALPCARAHAPKYRSTPAAGDTHCCTHTCEPLEGEGTPGHPPRTHLPWVTHGSLLALASPHSLPRPAEAAPQQGLPAWGMCSNTSSSLTHVSWPAGYLSRRLLGAPTTTHTHQHTGTPQIQSMGKSGCVPLGELSLLLPSFKMDGRESQTREGDGVRRAKGEGREQTQEVVEGGLGVSRQGGSGGRKVLVRPGPRELGPPTHSPQEQPRPQPGQGRAEQGWAGPG